MPTALSKNQIEKLIAVLGDSVDRGTTGHSLAHLLSLADEGSPYLGAVFRRLGKREWVQAAEKRLALTRFVDEVMEQPVGSWRRALAGAPEHHGSLMAIVLGNLALRHLPGRPLEALELVTAAWACADVDAPTDLDLEIRLLLTAVEAVAQRVGEAEPRSGEDRFAPIIEQLETVDMTIHPELVADTWWLCGVDRRLAGKLPAAERMLRHAVTWADGYGDVLRTAEFELERALVHELAGRAAEACEAGARALWALRWTGPETPLWQRAVLDRAHHLITAGDVEAADQWLERRVARLSPGREATVAWLRGRIARWYGRASEAEVLLESAEEIAERDGDDAQKGLAAVERLALLDECRKWDSRSHALVTLYEAMMGQPHAPPEIVTTLATLHREAPADRRLDPSVVRCLRLRFREWQARQHVPCDLRVM